MFEISFPELMVIAVVGLVVIGPERLPTVARAAGVFLGRARRYVNDIKSDFGREMQLDELRKAQTEIQDSVQRIEANIQSDYYRAETSFEEGVQAFQKAVDDPVSDDKKPDAP